MIRINAGRREFYGEDALAAQLTAAIQDAIEDYADADQKATADSTLWGSESESDPSETKAVVRYVVAPRFGYQASLGFDAAPDGATALLLSRAGLLELTMNPGGDPQSLRVVNPTPDVGALVEAVFPHSVRRAPTWWDELGLRIKG